MPRTLSRTTPRRRRAVTTGLIGSILLSLCQHVLPRPAAGAASTFTVNSIGDGADSNTADGVCNDGSGQCTLRAAIEQANATTGTDTIGFNIGSGGLQTIVLGRTTPDVTDPVVIDATTQPGYSGAPLVEVIGAENVLPPVSWALRITAGSSTVRGLAVGRVSVTGIALGGVGSGGHGGNKVESCYVGLRADGVTAAGIGGGCVSVIDSPDNVVGGTTAPARNVLSGCGSGVEISGALSTGNLVQGNYLGTDASGMAALVTAYNSSGVQLRSDASDNTIGGTAAGAGNVISGNKLHGILITAGSNSATIQGNFIGTNAAGDARRPNNLDGVRIASSPDNTVGGTAAGARNVISGNGQQGVNILGSNSTNNVVAGNYIGTNAAGTASVFNDGNGVRIEFSQNTVGGTSSAARNVISGNRSYGVSVDGGQSNAVQGNYIGTDAAGTGALQNLSGGVRDNATGTLIGGLTATPGTAPGNVISGNQTAIG